MAEIQRRPDPHRVMRDVSPLNWKRGIFVGMLSTFLMLLFVDCFNMLGITPFSYERFLGNLIRGTDIGTHSWTIGFFANLIVGAVFGLLYAYMFEYVFKRSSARIGVQLGFAHAALAALFFFPFFGSVGEFMGMNETYQGFGLMGAGRGVATFLILLLGHLVFGATIGLFYGPVRLERLRVLHFEPGEWGKPGEPGVITEDQDPQDRVFGGY